MKGFISLSREVILCLVMSLLPQHWMPSSKTHCENIYARRVSWKGCREFQMHGSFSFFFAVALPTLCSSNRQNCINKETWKYRRLRALFSELTIIKMITYQALFMLFKQKFWVFFSCSGIFRGAGLSAVLQEAIFCFFTFGRTRTQARKILMHGEIKKYTFQVVILYPCVSSAFYISLYSSATLKYN